MSFSTAIADLRYPPPTRNGRAVPHYLIAVDPGTARPGVSVWHVDPGTTRPATPRGDGFGCSIVLFGRAALLAGRAPHTAYARRTPAHAASVVVDVVAAVVSAHARGSFPVACVVEWPIKYATNTAARADVQGLRDMIAALPWRPRLKATPATWKGNVPKEITSARTLAALLGAGVEGPLGAHAAASTWGDLDAVGLVDDDPNARDAVALGAWSLSLTGRGASGGRGV